MKHFKLTAPSSSLQHFFFPGKVNPSIRNMSVSRQPERKEERQRPPSRREKSAVADPWDTLMADTKQKHWYTQLNILLPLAICTAVGFCNMIQTEKLTELLLCRLAAKIKWKFGSEVPQTPALLMGPLSVTFTESALVSVKKRHNDWSKYSLCGIFSISWLNIP